MTSPSDDREPLVETSPVRAAFQALFQDLYEVQRPELPLGRVMHWHDVARQMGLAENGVESSVTRLLGGSFYNTSTPAPTPAELDAALDEGRARGIQQFLVPTVRNTAVVG